MRQGGQRVGTIAEKLPRELYRVELEDGRIIRASIGSQARRVNVKFIPGDRVALELSSRDPTRGRITARLEQ